MSRKQKNTQWSAKNLLGLEHYVLSESQVLISNFYMNILVGYVRFPKPYGFFRKLSNRLGILPQRCASKYYKLEENLFTELLSVPRRHYVLYLNIWRQAKSDKRWKARDGAADKGEAACCLNNP